MTLRSLLRTARATSAVAAAAAALGLMIATPAHATEATPSPDATESATTATPRPTASATPEPEPNATATASLPPSSTPTPRPSTTSAPSTTVQPEPSPTPSPSVSATPSAPDEPTPKAVAYASPGLWSATTARTTFADVSADKQDTLFTPHAAAIAWLAEQGAGLGWGLAEDDERFRPDAPATRADLAAFLYRAAGMPLQVTPDESPFTDVDATHARYVEIVWLAASGVDLADDDAFVPDAEATRGEVALALHRLAGERRIVFVPGLSFDPVEAPSEYETSSDWLDGLGVKAPDPGSADAALLEPIPRGELAQLLFDVRAAGLPLSPEPSLVDRIGYVGDGVPTLVGDRNGLLPATALCALPWDDAIALSCHAAADLESLNAAFEATFAADIPVAGGYRDLSGQRDARATRGGMAAVPGTSQHGWGAAIDLRASGLPGGYGGDAYEWLVETAPRYGWALPAWAAPGGGKPEPWHLEHLG